MASNGKSKDGAPATDDKAVENEVVFIAPECPVDKVTVYPDRAEICRRVDTSLSEGLNQVVLKKLPDTVDPDSIRVEGKGAATITEVVFQSESVAKDEGDMPAKQKDLTTEKEHLEKEKKDLESELFVLKKQWLLLDGFANTASKGVKKEGTHVTAPELNDTYFKGLKDFLRLYAAEGNALEKKQIELQEKIETISDRINAITQNLQKMTNDMQTTNEIKKCTIVVECQSACKVTLLVSYVTSNASWKPSYDIRMFTAEDKLKITYYGQIRQSTGEDWTEAKLFLSTAMPSIGGEIPDLLTAELHLRKPRLASASPKRGFGFAGLRNSFRRPQPFEEEVLYCASASADAFMQMDFPSQPVAMPCVSYAAAEVGEGVATTMYEIARPSTIPSDNVEHKVTVGLVDIKPKISYTSVPKRVPHAFMLAKVTNSSPYTFLSGETSIFLDNTFVGKASMKDVYPLEEFECSLGVDPAVKITYKPLKKYRASSGIISKVISNTHEQVIEVKNTHDYDIQILVSDQFPRSADDRIKVHLLEPQIDLKHPDKSKDKDVTLNKSNNLEWSLEVKKQESKEVILKYTVDHPANLNLYTDERLDNLA